MNTDKTSKRSEELSIIISFLLDNKLKHIIALAFSILVSLSLYIYDVKNPIYKVESTYDFFQIKKNEVSISAFSKIDYERVSISFRDKLISTFNFQDFKKNNIKNISSCKNINLLKNRGTKFTVMVETNKGFEIAENCKQDIVKYVNDIKKIDHQSYIDGIENHIKVLEDSVKRGDNHIKTLLNFYKSSSDDVDPIEYMHIFKLNKQTIAYLELNRLHYNQQKVEYLNIQENISKGISLVAENKIVVKRYNKNVYFIIFVFFGFLSFFLSIILKK